MNGNAQRVFLLVVLMITPLLAISQPTKKDSTEVSKVVTKFYQWYFDLIRNDRLEEFNPSFVKTSDGMTTLDFKKYEQGLKNHSFDQNFIKVKIHEYTSCVSNLNKISYQTFLTYKDLDDFESINCAFSNVYEWIHSMEPFNSIKIKEINFVADSSSLVKIYFSDSSSEEPLSSAIVSLIKNKNKWLINKVEF